jgi:hypothetical protein
LARYIVRLSTCTRAEEPPDDRIVPKRFNVGAAYSNLRPKRPVIALTPKVICYAF